MVIAKASVDIHFNLDWHVGFEEAEDSAVVLNGQNSERKRSRMFAPIDKATKSRAGVVEERAS